VAWAGSPASPCSAASEAGALRFMPLLAGQHSEQRPSLCAHKVRNVWPNVSSNMRHDNESAREGREGVGPVFPGCRSVGLVGRQSVSVIHNLCSRSCFGRGTSRAAAPQRKGDNVPGHHPRHEVALDDCCSIGCWPDQTGIFAAAAGRIF